MSASDEDKKEEDVIRFVCSLWRKVEPDRMDYATVVGDMNSNRLLGDATIFEQVYQFPVTHMGYFKPKSDAFLLELKAKD